jgi:outer membrane protein assembly factor BamB
MVALRIALGLVVCGLALANWPQWRGPHLNGSNPTARDLAVNWSQTDNVVWRVELPSWSAATPIVWEDTVFVTSAEQGFTPLDRGARRQQSGPTPDKIFLLALNRKDGKVRWSRQIDSGNQLFRKQNSASPSPITDGKHVWIMTGNGKLTCFTMAGAEVWKRDIQSEYGRFGLNHGYASTPLMHGDRLYVQVLHGMHTKDPSYVFAADKATGKTIWRVERRTDARMESPDNYATPQLAKVKGKLELIVSGAD